MSTASNQEADSPSVHDEGYVYQATNLSNMADHERLVTIQHAGLRGSSGRRDVLWRAVSRNMLGVIKSKEEFTEHLERVTRIKRVARSL